MSSPPRGSRIDDDEPMKKDEVLVEHKQFEVLAAPNLSALVGQDVAMKLISTAGGLTKLARIPACNFQALGAKEYLAGSSTATSNFPVGHIGQTEVFQSAPPALKLDVCHLIANKSALAARVDSVGGSESGGFGRKLLDEVRKKVESKSRLLQSSLPVPDIKIDADEPVKKDEVQDEVQVVDSSLFQVGQSPAKKPEPLPVPDPKNNMKERVRNTYHRHKDDHGGLVRV